MPIVTINSIVHGQRLAKFGDRVTHTPRSTGKSRRMDIITAFDRYPQREGRNYRQSAYEHDFTHLNTGIMTVRLTWLGVQMYVRHYKECPFCESGRIEPKGRTTRKKFTPAHCRDCGELFDRFKAGLVKTIIERVDGKFVHPLPEGIIRSDIPNRVQEESIVPLFVRGLRGVRSHGSRRPWKGSSPVAWSTQTAVYYIVDLFNVVTEMPAGQNLKNGKPWYLLNGDSGVNRRSLLTPVHLTMQAAAILPNQPRVSYDLVANVADLPLNEINLVDFWRDTWMRAELFNEAYPYHTDPNLVSPRSTNVLQQKEFDNWEKTLPVGGLLSKERGEGGEVVAKEHHRIGSLLFMLYGKYYLCSMDEGRYFMSQLPRKCSRVATAFEMLKPRAVKEAIKRGVNVKRQGEWFLLPRIGGMPLGFRERYWEKWYALPQKDGRGDNVHVATRGVKLRHRHVVSRYLYHTVKGTNRRSGEHLAVNLGAPHDAIMNTAVASWSTTGRGID